MKQPISKRINGIHKTTSLRNNIIQVMNVMDCTSTGMNMDYFQNRLNTFDTYPKQMLPDKYRLASAGLYYTGKSDTCQCFRCHVKLTTTTTTYTLRLPPPYHHHLTTTTLPPPPRPPPPPPYHLTTITTTFKPTSRAFSVLTQGLQV